MAMAAALGSVVRHRPSLSPIEFGSSFPRPAMAMASAFAKAVRQSRLAPVLFIRRYHSVSCTSVHSIKSTCGSGSTAQLTSSYARHGMKSQVSLAPFIRRYHAFSSSCSSQSKSQTLCTQASKLLVRRYQAACLSHRMKFISPGTRAMVRLGIKPPMLSQVLKYSSKPPKGFFQEKLLNFQNSLTKRYDELPQRLRDGLEKAAIASFVATLECCFWSSWSFLVGAVSGATNKASEKEDLKTELLTLRIDLAVEKIRSGSEIFTNGIHKLRREVAKIVSAVDKVAGKIASDADRMKEDADRMKADADRMKADADRMKADAENMKADAENMKADAEKMKADAENMKADAEKMKADAEKMKSDVEVLKMLFLVLTRASWAWWKSFGSKKD